MLLGPADRLEGGRWRRIGIRVRRKVGRGRGPYLDLREGRKNFENPELLEPGQPWIAHFSRS